MSDVAPDSNSKGSFWKSLLSTLLDAGAKENEIFLAELAPGDEEWDFAYWGFAPDGAMCTYRCPDGKSVWRPIETPSYTGVAEKWQRDEKP